MFELPESLGKDFSVLYYLCGRASDCLNQLVSFGVFCFL